MRWPALLSGLVALSLVAGPAAPARAGPPAPRETGYCARLKTQTLSFDKAGEPAPVTAATFDCAKAATEAERLVCATPTLALSDLSLAQRYCRLLTRALPAERARLARDERAWLRSRQACRDKACLEVAYEAQDEKLSRRQAALDLGRRVRLSRPGDCETTRIEDLGARLEGLPLGPPTNGSSIAFADGVLLTSYEAEPGILKSRIGDAARVCLVSLPKHCPKGDDRGRIYSVQNLRTHDHLKLPDAEHSCGGA